MASKDHIKEKRKNTPYVSVILGHFLLSDLKVSYAVR